MKENNLLKDRAWIEIDLDNLVNRVVSKSSLY